ncbi:MAG: EF-P beta-lysylation protein EpmB [Pseudomonadota bacterium]
MIPVIDLPWESEEWRLILKQAYRSSHDLLQALGTRVPKLDPQPDFPVLVPQPFAARMTPGDPHDPLLRQVLALSEERLNQPGFTDDPLQESNPAVGFSRAPGLIHKYHGRVLLIATGGCAVHCRYCFRRHFPYAEHRDPQLDQAINVIRQDSSITEVILSGGDPLLLDDQALANLVTTLAAISHIKRLRIHTRLPVVVPQRITTALLDSLSHHRLALSVVVHSNHPAELDAQTATAFARLRQAGIWLFNQAVLLRGVNAHVDTQVQLAEALFAQDVLPYYLHVPDPVSGTHHFHLSLQECQQIYRELQARLPGYLVPRLVQEVPKKASKMIVSGA